MKKYIIRDNLGNKKTIYAKDLSHAMKLNDASIKDFEPFFFKEDESFKWDADYIGERLKIENFIDKYNDYEEFIDTEFTAKVLGGFGNSRENNEMRRYFEEKWPQKARLAHKLFDSIGSKVKDEANLATTIQALVNDEEAAVKAYEVAIKNLEGKIDGTQMQVLINIMKDERRHIENLYAVLNGQVTEKNLKDNKVRDGRHTDKFARILRGKGINFTITPDGEIKFNNRNDFKRALDLAEDYSFEFGGYDYDERNMLIEMAEAI